MLISIDGNEANGEKRVGIGQYAFHVLVNLYQDQKSNIKNQNHNVKFKVYLKDFPLSDLPAENEWWKYEVIGPKKLWTQIALPFHLLTDRNRPEVFFSPSHYAPRWSPVPTVSAIMDLSYIYYPELFRKKDLYQLKTWTAYSVRQATKIVTISEYSKKTIIDYYKIPDDKVVVTYPGYNRNNFQFSIINFQSRFNEIKSKYQITQNYILFVGTLQPRKNIKRLINAFEILSQYNLQLIIVGKRGWFYEDIIAYVKEKNFENKIKFMEYIDDAELAILYKGARCFVLPSLYEGFGIPVIEAMACGCPTVVSNVTSLPEIVGDAAILVNPTDSNDIARGILKVIENNRLRRILIEEGLKKASIFDWKKCAQKVMDTLTEISEKKV